MSSKATLPKGFCTATIVERIDFAEDLATFRLRPEVPLTFEPGQYATLALEIDGVPVKRAYSIVSAPHEPDLEFYVECVREGVLTPCLWELQPGREMYIRKKVVGHFTLDRSKPCHVMAATVTGLAPFLSMVRHQVHELDNGGPASDTGEPYRFLILHGASHAVELGPYREECMALAARYDWLHYVPTVSRPWADSGWTGETGRVEDVTRKWMDRLGFGAGETAGYACGNPDMIETVKGIFARARLDEDAIHEEKYFTTPATGSTSTVQPEIQPEPATKPKRKSRKPPPGALKLKAVKAPPSS